VFVKGRDNSERRRVSSAGEYTVVGSVTIEPVISVTVTIPVHVSFEAHVPSAREIIKNKDLWSIVVYCSLLEFYTKIRLQESFVVLG
jgi:hypothetical protein